MYIQKAGVCLNSQSGPAALLPGPLPASQVPTVPHSTLHGSVHMGINPSQTLMVGNICQSMNEQSLGDSIAVAAQSQ